MKIYYLSKQVKYIVKYYCDSDIINGIRLYTKLMVATRDYIQGKSDLDSIYHCGVEKVYVDWLIKGTSSFNYLLEFTKELCNEYEARYGNTNILESLVNSMEVPSYNTEFQFEIPPILGLSSVTGVSDIMLHRLSYYLDRELSGTWLHTNKPIWFDIRPIMEFSSFDFVKVLNRRIAKSRNRFFIRSPYYIDTIITNSSIVMITEIGDKVINISDIDSYDFDIIEKGFRKDYLKILKLFISRVTI